MTTGQQEAVDQRLDQHADAMETVLGMIDGLKRCSQIHILREHLLDRRIRELESIVLPAADKSGSARPSEPGQ